jgi:hypothetical protein
VTSATAPTPYGAIASAVKDDFKSATRPCPTSGVISAAVELLEALWAAADQKGVEPADFGTHPYDRLAPVALRAQTEAFRRQHDAGADPIGLVAEAIHATGQHLGQDVTILEGPVAYGDGPGAYGVLQRVSQTPPWGPDGDLNLVIHLRYGDSLSMSNSWEWTAHPDAGGTSHYITLIAPPPSLASAAEVGERIAEVLNGDIKAWPTARLPVG